MTHFAGLCVDGPLMIRAYLVLMALATAVASASATPPPRRSLTDAWHRVTRAAQKELEACKQLGGTAYGDVDVTYHTRKKRWSSSSAKSLGKAGPKVGKCMQDALERHFPLSYDHDDASAVHPLSSSLTIGARVPVLPPATTLLPIWRRAIGTGKDATTARAELVKLLPPDYKLTKERCLDTDRRAIEDGQYLWLPTAGAWIPRLWHEALKKLIGSDAHAVMWSAPGELVMKRGTALCLASFDAAKQAALRAEMDRVGSCWVGGFEQILLQPRVAFPLGEKYTSVSTFAGRTCATTTAGKVVCCGSMDGAPLPPAAQAMSTITLGRRFACGLEPGGHARCWGTIASPPAGTFAKLAASDEQVCGLKKSGEIVCWGSPTLGAPPAGTFTDLSVTAGRGCAVRRDGGMACWGEAQPDFPPGSFASVSVGSTHACAVRRDGLVACWHDDTSPTDIPLPEPFEEIAVSDGYRLCGRRRDATIRCSTQPTDRRLTSAPAGKMLMLAGHQSQTCGLRDDRSIECWGDPWPFGRNGDNTWRDMISLFKGPTQPHPATSIAGKVLDEHGRPLAYAEVLLCNKEGACQRAAHLARTSKGRLADLVSGLQNASPSDYAYAITDGSGHWTTTLAIRPDYASDRVHALFTGPGRELVERSSPYFAPEELGSELRLRPAIDLDVTARCPRSPCTGELRIFVSPYRWYDGTTLAHLSPGTYVVHIARDFGKPTEMRGKLVVDVTYATRSQQVALALQPVGTGQSISGTASLSGKTSGVHVIAKCGGSSNQAVVREAITDAHGRFELKNVGAPPCNVRLSSSASSGVTVDKLPATGVVVSSAETLP